MELGESEHGCGSGKPMTHGLAAIIVSHNSSEAAINFARQLVDQHVEQIVIFDSGSNPREKQKLSLFDPPQQVFVEFSEDNVGFGSAVNLGISQLQRWDRVLICNADLDLSPGCVSRLMGSARIMPTAVISPTILTGSKVAPIYWFRGAKFLPSRGYLRLLDKGKKTVGQASGYLATPFAPATALLVPRSLFEQLEGFREDLFMYWEDADFSLRAKEAGAQIICDLEATVWHEVGGSEPKTTKNSRSSAYYYYLQRNRLLVFGPRYGVLAMFWGTGFLQTVFPFVNIALRDREGFFSKIRASFQGVLDGLRGVAGIRPSEAQA